MKAEYNTYKPEGFRTVNSYMLVADPEAYIAFLEKAFFAKELNRTERDGEIVNSILKIGDSCFMLTKDVGAFEGMRTAFYLFVDNVDELYANTIEQGCLEVYPPEEMAYGDYQGGVKDPEGNYWWISKRLDQKNY